jgi:hypothetical protein
VLTERQLEHVVEIAEAGQSLLPLARRVLGDMAGLREELHALDPVVRGPLRIGVAQTAARVLDLPRLLVNYDERYPDVEVSVARGEGCELISVCPAARTGGGQPVHRLPAGHGAAEQGRGDGAGRRRGTSCSPAVRAFLDLFSTERHLVPTMTDDGR